MLDGPLSSFSQGFQTGLYALWLGSGISRERIVGLDGVLAKLLENLRLRIRKLLPQVFPGCKVGIWKPTKKKAKGKVEEALTYVQMHFEDYPDGVLPFAELRSVLGYDASNFNNRIRNHDSFKAGLEDMGIEEVIHGKGRHRNALAKVTQPFGPLEGAEYIADV